jgi:murein DD-endopeptidase MepM/ murein hydrolase activator NlpD
MRWSFLLAVVLGIGATFFVVSTEFPVDDPVWWYQNETPPKIEVVGVPGQPQRGPVQITVRFDPPDHTHVNSVTLDGNPVTLLNGQLSLEPAHLADGQHKLAISVRDTSRRQNPASGEWSFTSDNTGPQLALQTEPPSGPVEGETFVIRLQSNEPVAEFQGTVAGRPVRLRQAGDRQWVMLEGVQPSPPFQSMILNITAKDAVGNESKLSQELPVKPTAFPEELLPLGTDLDALAAPEVRAESVNQLRPIFEKDNGPALWTGRFQLPVAATTPITTEFATRRSYNGRVTDSNHGGVDFGSFQGTRVMAPAPAEVAYVGRTAIHGNVLILSHGGGVYSMYAHLQQILVAQGDKVAQGDSVALVGTTGLSTGPHLHWEIWVNGGNVDPLVWTERAFP